MKKRLQFLNDTALGFLLRIYFGLIEPVGKNYVFTIHTKDEGMLASLADVSNLIKVTITTSKTTKDNYEQLVAIENLTSEAKGRAYYQSHYITEIRKREYIYDFLKRYMPYEKPIPQSELGNLFDRYPDFHGTLVYLVKVPVRNLRKLKSFVKLYSKNYSNKDLQMQERMFLPSVQAEQILSIINDPNNIALHGTKRLLISSIQNQELLPLLFHELMYLAFDGKIRINSIIMYYTQGSEIEIDNLTQETPSQEKISPPATAYWQDNFKWKGNEFIFGRIGSIEFEDQKRKGFFEMLANKKGTWLKRSEFEKDGFDYDYVRPTVDAVNTRLLNKTQKKVKIVSTKSDETSYPKPDGNVSAYRIRITP